MRGVTLMDVGNKVNGHISIPGPFALALFRTETMLSAWTCLDNVPVFGRSL